MRSFYRPPYKLSQEIIMEYDDSLLGNRPYLSTYYFERQASPQATVLELIRYACETRLNWSPEQLRDYLTMDILQLLGLRHLFKYINFPDYLSPSEDLFYVAWCIYPWTQDTALEDLEIRAYKRLLSSETVKFPKKYFHGLDGLSRACACLRYVITTYHPFENTLAMYRFFASAEAVAFLREYKLLIAGYEQFESPLEFLHTALPETQKDETFYQYFCFWGSDWGTAYHQTNSVLSVFRGVGDEAERLEEDESESTSSCLDWASAAHAGTAARAEKPTKRRSRKDEIYPRPLFRGLQKLDLLEAQLRYILFFRKPFQTVPEMYKFFATKEAIVFLRKYMLLTTAKRNYETPLHYLHAALNEKSDDALFQSLLSSAQPWPKGRKHHA